MRIIALILISLSILACNSKAGPFITNISSDGKGGLTVEKCMVNLNRMITTVESSDCTNTSIALSR